MEFIATNVCFAVQLLFHEGFTSPKFCEWDKRKKRKKERKSIREIIQKKEQLGLIKAWLKAMVFIVLVTTGCSGKLMSHGG